MSGIFTGPVTVAVITIEMNFAMKAATERNIIRWLHIIASIPIIGYIYGPVKDIPNAVIVIKWVLFPMIVLSGLWLWKGHLLRKAFRARRHRKQIASNTV